MKTFRTAAFLAAFCALSCSAADNPALAPEYDHINVHYRRALNFESLGYYDQAFQEFRNGSRTGDSASMEKLSDYYLEARACEKDTTKAVWWLQRSFTAGNVGAAFKIGEHLRTGRGGINSSQTYAVWWYTQAAEQGNVPAMEKLGESYITGTGCRKNIANGISWYEKAGAKGSTLARIRLAEIHTTGMYGEPDYEEAVRQLTLAADNGSARAHLMLSEMFLDGKGVPHDLTAAHAFASAAKRLALQPLPDSGFKRLIGKMSEAEKNAANALLADILKIDGASDTVAKIRLDRGA